MRQTSTELEVGRDAMADISLQEPKYSFTMSVACLTGETTREDEIICDRGRQYQS